ncbi:DUF6512 family protein [Papillibacter cinnamivorans]|uniref:Uncharacterized protein n=1 Tax=Papillibacter cinnamivorans DSM 12816 TaxID=1122930 RepID=A0A1W2B969_9FIRM|nr:DUF6512 family protein [Papillibacter cinnamivorans]SMC68898.1 hypothetical protein SAMN02745168_2073 [Papillibacter cinnamivorans DSM 12816]
MQKMFRRHCIAFVLAVLAGTGLHFLYTLFPNPVSAVFSPVQESVWEHLKMLYWPYLVAAILLTRNRQLKNAGYWGAHFAAMLVMVLIVVGGFYILSGALGVEGTAVDVALFVIALAVAFYLSYRMYSSEAARDCAGVLCFFVILLGAAIVLFTFLPPALPLFESRAEALGWMTIPY